MSINSPDIGPGYIFRPLASLDDAITSNDQLEGKAVVCKRNLSLHAYPSECLNHCICMVASLPGIRNLEGEMDFRVVSGGRGCDCNGDVHLTCELLL